MTSASYALQVALGACLAANPGVTGLVPAANIRDGSGVPERFPSIALGQDQEVEESLTLARRHVRVHSTLHVWDRSPGLATVKAISGAIREAIKGGRPALSGCRLIDLKFAGSRFLRDPDGVTAHGVVDIEALVELPS